MRLIAYAQDGAAKMGLVDDSGESVRSFGDLAEFYRDVDGALALGPAEDATPLADVELVPFVPDTARIFCLGLNYQAHIDEVPVEGRERPAAPNVFARWASTLDVDGGAVAVPDGESGLDWEGELAVVVGGSIEPGGDPMDVVVGYACYNDISARTYQTRVSQFTLGKNVDGSGPLGPVLVTADEFGDPYGRSLVTRMNGEVMQAGSTDMMIFDIAESLAYISEVTPLRAGDVLATGTPDGVGIGRDPIVLMQPGDTVEVEIEGIGTLHTHIV